MSKKKPAAREAMAPRDLSAVLKGAPPGAWVALSHDKTHVVGTAKSIEAATLQAQLNGEPDPLLIKIPLEDEGIAAAME